MFENDFYSKHTSKTVIKEVKLKEKKRTKLYELLISHLNSDGDLSSFEPTEEDIYLNANDKGHLFQLVRFLGRESDSLGLLRLFNRVYRKRLSEAQSKLCEICSYANDAYLEDLIRCHSNVHLEDAKIIVDSYYWCEGRNNPKYITLERKSLIDNRNNVISILNKYRPIKDNGFELLNIFEIDLNRTAEPT